MSEATDIACIRALTQHITNTAPANLPEVAARTSGWIWRSRRLLAGAHNSKRTSEATTVVHHFRTQITTLLQARSVESRWSGVVLLKATIEAGGLETLSKSNNWVRCLLSILKKPEPSTTHVLAITTLTRIFTLTWVHSNLVREITTPALPAFVETCLGIANNARCSPKLLCTILEAFCVLLPRHPTIFRSAEGSIRARLKAILFDSASGSHHPESCRYVAARLWPLLPSCAPKQGASEQWDDGLKDLLSLANVTRDQIFHEAAQQQKPASMHSASTAKEGLGLPSWADVSTGSTVLCTTIQLIRSHVESSTHDRVPLRVGMIVGLLHNILGRRSSRESIDRLSQSVTKAQRDDLMMILPRIRQEALELAISLIRRLGQTSQPIASQIFEDVLNAAEDCSSDASLRAAIYRALTISIHSTGSGMPKFAVLELSPILKLACNDLLSTSETNDLTSKANGLTEASSKQSADPSTATRATAFPVVESAARELLIAVLRRIDATYIPPKVRTQIDRTAVLTRDRDMLIASVMNPARRQNDARAQSSLMPFLAAEFAGDAAVEALLRPRMPQIRLHGTESVNDEEEEESDEDEVAGLSEVESAEPAQIVDLRAREPKATPASIASAEQAPQDSAGKAHESHALDTMLTGKRKASGLADDDGTAKRSRSSASPSSAPLHFDQDAVASKPSGDIRNEHDLDEDAQMVVLAEPASRPDTEPSKTVRGLEASMQAPVIDDEDGVDSDFEMPPLTMDPDTDSEAEES